MRPAMPPRRAMVRRRTARHHGSVVALLIGEAWFQRRSQNEDLPVIIEMMSEISPCQSLQKVLTQMPIRELV